jgi:hypothetical protein
MSGCFWMDKHQIQPKNQKNYVTRSVLVADESKNATTLIFGDCHPPAWIFIKFLNPLNESASIQTEK